MKSPFHLGRLCTGYYRASMPVSALISVVMGQSDPKRAERLADGRSDRPLVARSGRWPKCLCSQRLRLRCVLDVQRLRLPDISLDFEIYANDRWAVTTHSFHENLTLVPNSLSRPALV
jgi:hypothetical protein